MSDTPEIDFFNKFFDIVLESKKRNLTMNDIIIMIIIASKELENEYNDDFSEINADN